MCVLFFETLLINHEYYNNSSFNKSKKEKFMSCQSKYNLNQEI